MTLKQKVHYAGSGTGIIAAVVMLGNIWKVGTMILESWPLLRAFLPLIAICVGTFSLIWFGITVWEHIQAWREHRNFNPKDWLG